MAREERRMGGCKITDWWTDWKGKGKRLRVENMLWGWIPQTSSGAEAHIARAGHNVRAKARTLQTMKREE